ncbi:Receptor-type tyrosine-protein phosphatase alpha [Geodia barretti]|uniref:protein-tyrosine-phosphatase n=2 Tax=Geodia barretti TaxID=519541 RepID=A0AA35RI59_GEOBA|nr:Receptor-type tyrosine-protein phosphatase alpha [Geodia barretti]
MSLKRLSLSFGFESFHGFTPSSLPINPIYVSHNGEAIEHALSTETTMIEPPMAPIEEKTGDQDIYLLDIEGSDDSPALKKNAFFDPILAEMFGDYVTRCHSSDNRDFKHQFTVMQDCGAGFSTIAGSNTSLQKLNRFANIMPYENNRVFLMAVERHTEYKGDYINASYIDGYNFEHKFIATQGPLPNTTVDFWRMVWQERSRNIVMVTNLVEGNRIKCHKYWPETGTLSFGPFNVTITGQQILADYTTREFSVQLTESSEPALSVTQFHFTAWPDHGVPDYATSLLAFHKKVKKHHKPFMGPITVHCSAGVGRTGTLITIDCVLEQLQEEKVVDIAGVIIHLRTQRMKMVQSLEQYIFIHDAILEVLMCGDTQIDAACNLRRVTQRMSECDPQTNLNEFEKQFKVLEKVSVKPEEITRNEALRNPTKNRSDYYLPGDAWRVTLRGDLQTYIHAVFVNGYKQQRAFIMAQSPMESTARDFWKMVHDRKCGVIVMLCDLVENGQETCYQYWPQTGLIQFVGYKVDLMEENVMEGFIMRKLSVYSEKASRAHQVVQLHMTNWSPDGSCSHLATITSVINEMSAIQRRTGNHPVVVHCSDTVGRSGMFCAIVTTIERCKTEGVVDVFQVVKALRIQKPGAVLTVTQYHLLFEAILAYLDSFDAYCNFLDL